MDGNGDRFIIDKWSNRNFALYDGEELVCVTVYKKGANEVKRRFLAYELLLVEGEMTLKPKQGDCPDGET